MAGGDIGNGDWLECVDATDCAHLMVGALYQVEHVWLDVISWYGDESRNIGVDLVGVPRDEPRVVYDLVRFRPIGPGDPESLRRKADEPIREDA